MINLNAALSRLSTAGISLKDNFHVLRSDQVAVIAELAKEAGYRKPKYADGSTGRYYFSALARKYRKECAV